MLGLEGLGVSGIMFQDVSELYSGDGPGYLGYGFRIRARLHQMQGF